MVRGAVVGSMKNLLMATSFTCHRRHKLIETNVHVMYHLYIIT